MSSDHYEQPQLRQPERSTQYGKRVLQEQNFMSGVSKGGTTEYSRDQHCSIFKLRTNVANIVSETITKDFVGMTRNSSSNADVDTTLTLSSWFGRDDTDTTLRLCSWSEGSNSDGSGGNNGNGQQILPPNNRTKLGQPVGPSSLHNTIRNRSAQNSSIGANTAFGRDNEVHSGPYTRRDLITRPRGPYLGRANFRYRPSSVQVPKAQDNVAHQGGREEQAAHNLEAGREHWESRKLNLEQQIEHFVRHEFEIREIRALTPIEQAWFERVRREVKLQLGEAYSRSVERSNGSCRGKTCTCWRGARGTPRV
ncbi:hypothetical protein MPTK1_7g06640 [Marchantia polymorpha subsp. ruderalis]|uniref:Uncharacterized protein n=2 Tax=Marchantia polymorpha TaxID=3197 RepID=A0AAF6BWU4_MARPO|nr:hypothetical protein MARPO_0057s0003 [Marchantia polymorpha]BBN16478.1 hypothetical protein Mp_7g06640 [Marchantia polymorpha subsp. ruderalis]|eukprot:PTQ37360.1 hypothetical protein MARPO_0057s0003 [Marchantia polymorpha]